MTIPRTTFSTRVTTAVVATLGISLGALPADAKPVTTTEHEFKALNVIAHIDNPCTGVLGTLTEVENGVAHLTATGVDLGDPSDPADDRPIPPYTSTFNVENHFTFVPDDPNQPSYVGHSHTHVSERFAAFPGIMQFENNIRARGDDGSVLRVREVARAEVSADGAVRIIFDRVSCESG